MSLSTTYTVTLAGALGGGASGSDSEDFLLYVVAVTGSQADIEFRIGDGDLLTPIVSFTTAPDTGVTYSFNYELWMADEVTAGPTWLSVDTNSQVKIDSTAVPASGGIYNVNLKGNVQGHTHTAWKFAPFAVTLYTYTESVVVDQVYSIGSTQLDYVFDAFTLDPSSLGYTSTYTLEKLSDSSDATAAYAWLSIDSASRTISVVETDEALAGNYDIVLKGTLNDGFTSTATVNFQIHLVDIIPTAQDDIVYFID